MGTITFDTLKFANTLKNAGVPDKQAEAMATAQSESLAQAFDATVATKGDVLAVKNELVMVKTELKSDIAALRAEMQALELRLTIKLGAFLVIAVGVIVTLLKH